MDNSDVAMSRSLTFCHCSIASTAASSRPSRPSQRHTNVAVISVRELRGMRRYAGRREARNCKRCYAGRRFCPQTTSRLLRTRGGLTAAAPFGTVRTKVAEESLVEDLVAKEV
jgi:hypothetical protein